MTSSFGSVLADTLPPVLTAIVTIALGALVGRLFTDRWELSKKRREIDLAAAGSFYTLHGDFYGLWRRWSAVLARRFEAADHEAQRFALFQDACAAVGRIEALVVKLAVERELSDHDRALLGCYRQAYRTASRSLEENRYFGVGIRDEAGKIVAYDDWNRSDSDSYQAFKELGAAVGALVGQAGRPASPAHARESLRIITDNIFERPRWVGEARHRLGLPPAGDERLRERCYSTDGRLRQTITIQVHS